MEWAPVNSVGVDGSHHQAGLQNAFNLIGDVAKRRIDIGPPSHAGQPGKGVRAKHRYCDTRALPAQVHPATAPGRASASRDVWRIRHHHDFSQRGSGNSVPWPGKRGEPCRRRRSRCWLPAAVLTTRFDFRRCGGLHSIEVP